MVFLRLTSFLILNIVNVECVRGNDNYIITKGLYDKLFSGNYSSDILPICDKGETVNITISTALREVVEINEKFQTLKLKIWVRFNWRDCNLQWNSSLFDDVDLIHVPYEKIWIPDITLYEGTSEFGSMPQVKDYRAAISSDGQVQYNFPSTVTTACSIDVTYFPFDIQRCSLTFGSWIHSMKHLGVYQSSASADTSAFLNHNEWRLISMESNRLVSYYNCCAYPYSKVSFQLVIKREPKFYIITIIFPCILVTSLAFIGFCLPPSCSEKISLQITVLLSITVFLLLIQDKLPSSSDTFPVIAYFFTASMILVCVACIMAGLVLFTYYKRLSGKAVPKILRKIFLNVLSDVFCVNYEECVSKDINVSAVFSEVRERRMSSVYLKDALRRRESFASKKIQKQMHEDIPEESSVLSIPLSLKNGDNGHISRRESLSSVFVEAEKNKDKNHDNLKDLEKVIHEWVHLAHVIDRFCLACYTMIYFTVAVTFIVLYS
ncbi:neuronal acetylcholine receptor subunit alpha-10-like [Saccostrea cucullata]|uniref:neuronal acetylcholine receptor subunit alpha-10-like n=1 Tax=Saccostrea cuccullata TaxID=36930 RepID=UPI002ED2DC86